jgi:hypothetical protein
MNTYSYANAPQCYRCTYITSTCYGMSERIGYVPAKFIFYTVREK